MDTQTALQQLEFMSNALGALRYLDTLLDIAINADGGGLADNSSGLHYLMNAHLDELQDGVDLLLDYVKCAERDQITQPGLPNRRGLSCRSMMPIPCGRNARRKLPQQRESCAGPILRPWRGIRTSRRKPCAASWIGCWQRLDRNPVPPSATADRTRGERKLLRRFSFLTGAT